MDTAAEMRPLRRANQTKTRPQALAETKVLLRQVRATEPKGNRTMSYDTMQERDDELIATIDRSYNDKTEEVRISIGNFKGKQFASVRLFYKTPDGEWRPTQKGITVRPKELDTAIQALTKIKARLAR